MMESYNSALEEFKRVDHLYYVTLKYTRTVDVIRSTIERVIATFEFLIECILKIMLEEGMIEEIPSTPVARGILVKEKCTDEIMCTLIESYLELRKVLRMPYTKREEYRRHVTMVADNEGETIEIDIDKLKEYYDDVKKMLSYTKQRLEPHRD